MSSDAMDAEAMNEHSGRNAAADGLLGVVVQFCRVLRERGVSVTPAESIDASRTLGVVDLGDREDVRLSLRAVLISRLEDFAAFDEAFDEAWQLTGGIPSPILAPNIRRESRPPDPQKRSASVSLTNWMKQGTEPNDDDPINVRTASDLEALGSRDFATYAADDDEAFRRLAAQIARRLAMRKSRRWRMARRGERIDLRRTARTSLRTGGVAIRLERRTRRLRRTRLVVLCDVSGSMELYSRFLLQFLHALQNSFATVESFVFATRLSRITLQLRGARYRDALKDLGRDVRDWSGGTRIGSALQSFVDAHRKFVDRRTIVLIVSDGWDVGDPVILEEAMRAIAHRSGRVIWLNPLMGGADFSPATRGMQAALPYIDVLAPGHSLDALRKLVRDLVL
ncbi:MAG: VWA domain-containing protein [Gemmatimonadaceae bacterium]